ncbi:4'-phosphopantetheinyl transferase EntD [Streptacidiphilus sp. EB103A]
MIRELVPRLAASAEVFGDAPEARMHPDEEAAVALAVESRRREFATVRHCARQALDRLGFAYRPLVPGAKGEPTWPDNVVGSMTHCAGYRAAAVARDRDLASLGIDAEPDQPLPPDMLEVIALPEEGERIQALLRATDHRLNWDRLLFSAKEAVYKAWFPLTRALLEFHEADITFDGGTVAHVADHLLGGSFEAELLVPGPAVGGRELRAFRGRWAAGNGLLGTAVAVPAPVSAACASQSPDVTNRTRATREFTPNLW